ncbi:MAG: hypothetical protein P8Y44_13755, partial [Acidobacteriota bacterium]
MDPAQISADLVADGRAVIASTPVMEDEIVVAKPISSCGDIFEMHMSVLASQLALARAQERALENQVPGLEYPRLEVEDAGPGIATVGQPQLPVLDPYRHTSPFQVDEIVLGELGVFWPQSGCRLPQVVPETR